MRFLPATCTLRGRLTVAADVEAAFPLFSPQGETSWVPGWAPEYLDPPEPAWRQGQVFRTQEEMGEAVWLITRLDRRKHEVEYHRVEPGRYVARIEVRCQALPQGRTEVSTAYSFLGLSEKGNRNIAALSQDDYDAKMARWSDWIDGHLAGAGA